MPSSFGSGVLCGVLLCGMATWSLHITYGELSRDSLEHLKSFREHAVLISSSSGDQLNATATANSVLALGAAKHRAPITELVTRFQQTPTLPLPVFIASLPKSGTTSASHFFSCGGAMSSHTYVLAPTRNNNTHLKYRMRSGICAHRNVQQGRPLFEGCQSKEKNYSVYSDAGYFIQRSKECFYPSIHALEEFYQSYPNATIMLFHREPNSWYKSVSTYLGGSIHKKWRQCQLGGAYMKNESDQEYFGRIYKSHRERVRQFVEQHPSLTYFEFPLEADTNGNELQRITGINASCWRDHAPK